MLRRRHRLVAVGVALILGVGCRTVSDEAAMHDLPPPPPDDVRFSDYQPDNPFLPWQDGVAGRSVYKTESSGGFSIEVRDLLISSTRQEAPFSLEGAAVLQVRQGSGEAVVGRKKIKLHPGTAFTVDKGEPLHITACGEPIAFRAWIVSPRREP